MYKEKILHLLRSAKTGFVSGEQLAATMGISRTMVWKHIKSLEREGFGIEAVPSRGYRITSVPDRLRADEIRAGLKTKIIGTHLHVLPDVTSTNALAMEMAAQGAPEGTTVIAETQSAGRGRLGRKWISPPGNLYLSIILRPGIPTYKAPLITLTGAVATASAIRAHCQLPAGIKWPNDILLSGKKVSGLLTEMSAEPDRVRHIVLGIGVDVNMEQELLPAELQESATTLASEARRRIDRTALLRQLLLELEQWYQVFLLDAAGVLREWTRLNLTTGSRVSVSGTDGAWAGLAQGIDSEGRLLIRLDDGSQRTVAAGDVTILKDRAAAEAAIQSSAGDNALP